MYYCPTCGAVVTRGDKECPSCHCNLRKKVRSSSFGFENNKGLYVAIIISTLIASILVFVTYGKLNSLYDNKLDIGLIIFSEIIAVIFALISLLFCFCSENSKFVGLLILGIAIATFFMAIYYTKDGYSEYLANGVYSYIGCFFLVGIAIVIFATPDEIPVKKVFLCIYSILFLIAQIIGLSSCGSMFNTGYSEIDSIATALVFAYIFRIVHCILMVIFSFNTYAVRSTSYEKFLGVTDKPNIAGNNFKQENLYTPPVQKEETKPDSVKKLKELKELLDLGVITEDEFKEKKEKYLKDL